MENNQLVQFGKGDRIDYIIDALKQCRDIKERYDKLHELVPEAWLLSPLSARKLVVWLQRGWDIDFGVCRYFKLEKDGDKQYCLADDFEVECLCVIPEPYCVIRDGDGNPKYPELFVS